MSRKFSTLLSWYSLLSLFFASLLLTAGGASAYQMYDDPASNNDCRSCHGAWNHSTPVPHRPNATSTCNLCHTSPSRTPVYTYKSTGISGDSTSMFGCTGCHGHDYGELSSEGAPKATARGLRLHHANAGVTVCASCHTDGVPYPENSPAPPYYSRADVNVKNPCNADGTEDLTGDGRGLDNDGDMLYDANDPDCSAAPCAVLPGVMTGLLAAKDTIRDDIRFHWTLDQVAGMYRVYSVGLAADFPPRGDNTAATERCSTPDGLTDNCAHTGIVPSAPNLLFYQVVGVCASNPSVEGPN